MDDSVLFSRVMDEFGNMENEKEGEKEGEKDAKKALDPAKDKLTKKSNLMQEEERLTGSVSNSVYTKYLRFAGGLIWAPTVLVMLTAYQGASGTCVIYRLT